MDSSPGQGPEQNPASASARKHFGLTGPSVVLDRRINAVRGDIADIALAGVLFAPHYARPMERRCIVPVAAIRAKTGDSAELVSELLHGEAFEVVDLSGGWAWGFSAHDHYVGYVRENALGVAPAGEWRVSARAAALREGPEAGAAIKTTLSMGAIVDGSVADDVLVTDEGVIDLSQLSRVADRLDAVEQAEKLVGAPYHLGGRNVEGIDCSGLVQIALSFAGIAAQRDSDLQAATTGEPLADDAPLRRGDLVFFPGHVGMMVDGERMIHANGHAMAVTIEPLADVTARMLSANKEGFKARRP